MTIANAAPADNATDVRRDWSITADITATGGVDSVATTVDGVAVTDTETTIPAGKRVEYTAAVSSSYGDRVLIKMVATLTEAITWAASTDYTTDAVKIGDGLHYECTTAGTSATTEPAWPETIDATVTDNDSAAWVASTAYVLGDMRLPTTANGFNYECTTAGTSDATEPVWPTTAGTTITDGTAVWTCRVQPIWTCKDDDYTYEWRFSITTGVISATSSPPPEVIVVKDISLTTDEADEIYDSINVVWLPEKTHPLIVDESQAEAVGKVEVENNVYHKHVRTLLVDRTDDNADVVSSLQEGDLITFTATALSETAQKAEVLAIRQTISQDNDVQYNLVVQYYEAV